MLRTGRYTDEGVLCGDIGPQIKEFSNQLEQLTFEILNLV